jgi:UDP-N-acetylglucosamine acyltransferase
MNDSLISPLAYIHPQAKIAENVKIHPFCFVGPNVEIASDCELHPHTVIHKHTKIGHNNIFYSFGSIGGDPQDYTYRGEDTELIIGDGNIFHENVTLNRGTLKEEGITRIGSNSLIMAYVHVGHDCVLGSNLTIANSCNLAGHVHVEDGVIIGGGTAVQQFVNLRQGCYIGGATAVNKDIPSFCTAYGNRVVLKGVNIIGMKRKNYERKEIMEVVDLIRSIESSDFSPSTFIEKKELMAEFNLNNPIIQKIISDIKNSRVGIAPFGS